MRTTLRIDEDLFRELKKRASRKGLSLSELVNLALRQSFATEKHPRRLFPQKTRDLGRPTFDVTKANAVAAALGDEEALRKLAGSSTAGRVLAEGADPRRHPGPRRAGGPRRACAVRCGPRRVALP